MELVTMDLSAQTSSDTGVLEGIMCEGQTSSAMRQKNDFSGKYEIRFQL